MRLRHQETSHTLWLAWFTGMKQENQSQLFGKHFSLCGEVVLQGVLMRQGITYQPIGVEMLATKTLVNHYLHMILLLRLALMFF